MARLTLAAVRAALAPFDVVIRKSDGEYRVNFRGGREETAYYTHDIEDARDTGRAMAAAGIK